MTTSLTLYYWWPGILVGFIVGFLLAKVENKWLCGELCIAALFLLFPCGIYSAYMLGEFTSPHFVAMGWLDAVFHIIQIIIGMWMFSGIAAGLAGLWGFIAHGFITLIIAFISAILRVSRLVS